MDDPLLIERAMEELPKTPKGKAWLEKQFRECERCQAYALFWYKTLLLSILGFLLLLLLAPNKAFISGTGLIAYLPSCFCVGMFISGVLFAFFYSGIRIVHEQVAQKYVESIQEDAKDE